MTAESIINHLWQSSCFALFAGVLAFMLRANSAKVRYWVWLSASLKFLVPWALLVSLGSVVPWPVPRVLPVATAPLPDTLIQIAEPFSPTPYAIVQTQAHWGVTALGFLWAAGFLAIVFTRCRSWYGLQAFLRAGTPVKLPIGVPAIVTPNASEPGIVGFLRPVLVLPELLLERLNSTQIDALLAHELSHVRRRDNFFAALHMGVEAIFWFHPLVWWIGSRMLEERELACDEEVLRLGCAPADYVRGILTVCEHYSEAPLPCVSGVTGADIKKRLKAILRGDVALELNIHRKLVLTFAAIAAVAVPVALGVWNAPAAHAQSPAPRFEVVSIKPHKAGFGPRIPACTGDRFSSSVGFGNLLAFAYDLQGREGSDLLQRAVSTVGQFYDIEAKAAAPVASESQCRLMVQALLADRFKLAFHYEDREAELFDLVVARDGPKLPKALPTDEGSDVNIVVDGRPAVTWVPIADPEERARTKGMTLEELARRLMTTAPLPVTDKTGLEGRYKIDLRYSISVATANQDTPEDPPLDAALAKLGLRLEKRRGTVKFLVLDHIEKPAAN